MNSDKFLKQEKRDTVIDAVMIGVWFITTIVTGFIGSPWWLIAIAAFSCGSRFNMVSSRMRVLKYMELSAAQDSVIEQLLNQAGYGYTEGSPNSASVEEDRTILGNVFTIPPKKDRS